MDPAFLPPRLVTMRILGSEDDESSGSYTEGLPQPSSATDAQDLISYSGISSAITSRLPVLPESGAGLLRIRWSDVRIATLEIQACLRNGSYVHLGYVAQRPALANER